MNCEGKQILKVDVKAANSRETKVYIYEREMDPDHLSDESRKYRSHKPLTPSLLPRFTI